ncbi:site-specific integrase [bacterium]|nr:MAG: site-specific integrase [bacterium]
MSNRTISFKNIIIKSKANAAGEAPIYVRVNIDGKLSDIATKRQILPERWNSETGAVKGNKEDARSINTKLDEIKAQLWAHYHKLEREEQDITSALLKRRFTNLDKPDHTLTELINIHNKMMNERVGIEFAPGTAKRYSTLAFHVKNFLKLTYKIEDIKLKMLNYQFILDFEHYFKVKRECNHNSTLKYIRNLRKVINLGIRKGWIEKDPFIKFSAKVQEVKREYLTKDDLSLIEGKDISIPRLELVKDIFLFSCYTGLAYIDVYNLTKANLIKGNDDELWIHTQRQKTEAKSHIPLLPIPAQIISKYKNHPECIHSDKLLPIKSNQKMNAYLKELADLCGINKNISFHTARHTFATTVTLTNNVPIESVSAMLGHKSIRTTQHYAKIVDMKVGNDMKALKNILSTGLNG